MTKSSLEDKGFLSIHGEVHHGKAGTWRQALKQRPGRRPDYGLSFVACSACFLTQPRNIYLLGVVPPTVCWDLTHQPFIKKMPKDLPTGQSDRGETGTEGPSSLLTLARVELTHTETAHSTQLLRGPALSRRFLRILKETVWHLLAV